MSKFVQIVNLNYRQGFHTQNNTRLDFQEIWETSDKKILTIIYVTYYDCTLNLICNVKFKYILIL